MFSLTRHRASPGLLAAKSFEKRSLKSKLFLEESYSLLLPPEDFAQFQGCTEHPGLSDFLVLKRVISLSIPFRWCGGQHTNSASQEFQNRRAGS